MNTQTREEKIAKITAEADKKIAKELLQFDIAEALPVVPQSTHAYELYGSIGSASYRAQYPNKLTRAEAFEVYKKLEHLIIPSFLIRGSCVGFKPYDDDREYVKESTECHARYSVDGFKSQLEFYVKLDLGIVRIQIEVQQHMFGGFEKQYETDHRGKNKSFRYVFRPTPLLCEWHRGVVFAAAERTGESSKQNHVYIAYEPFEVERLLTAEK